MKSLMHALLFTFSLCLLTTSLLAQERLKPSKTETLATFTILQPNKQPFANAVVLFKGNKGSKVTAKTNASGIVKTLLPNNENFTTVCGENLNENLIRTGNRAYSAIGGQRYTHRFIEYSFYYKNYTDEGIKDELITVISNSGKTYTQTTDAKGLALFYLPIQEKYTVNTTYYPNAKKIDLVDGGHAFVQISHPFRWMSSLEKEQTDIREAKRAQEVIAQQAIQEKNTPKPEEVVQEEPIKNTIPANESTLVVFFASQREYKGDGTITIYDGGKGGAVIGKVNSVWNCTRGPLKEEDIEASIRKRKGTYKFYAKSAQGMAWQGTYEVSGNGQKNIPLRIKDK